jgi:hypothetical protein
MSDVEKRLAQAERDRETYLDLLCVPLRGTEAWEKREALGVGEAGSVESKTR